MLRNTLLSTFLKLLWERLQDSGDAELAAIAGKALKEARYHQQHAADWLVRLGDGTEESRRRIEAALATLWPYTAELFEADEVDAAAVAAGLGPAWSELREPWLAEIGAITRFVFAKGRDLASKGSAQGTQVSAATARQGVPIPIHTAASRALEAMGAK